MTPPRWVRDCYPTFWLAGREAAIRQLGSEAAVPLGEAEGACSAALLYHPKRAAWWAGYAILVAERQAVAARRAQEADRA